jgi:uncharacterized Fe-S cluster-containing radical SAM superfamily protein
MSESTLRISEEMDTQWVKVKRPLYDPVKLAQTMVNIVVRGRLRKYYRVVRADRWYGGIATADCCGCCLRCVFCWSGMPRDRPTEIGKFCEPEYVFNKLVKCAKKHNFALLRVSGNEPTIGRGHLQKLLELVDQTRFTFILETNGIPIGYNSTYAKQLSKFSRLHVRVSVKGASPDEFSMLTGAVHEAFELQLKALENLLNAGISCNPAVMLSFSKQENIKRLKERFKEVDPLLIREFEKEYVFLYPHVIKRLKQAGIKPIMAYSPDKIPCELI